MASNVTRTRLEWYPGDAAREALEIAERVLPLLRRQEVMDYLVLLGLWTLQQPPQLPPRFEGRDRDAWRLPSALRPRDRKFSPGNSGPNDPPSQEEAKKIPGEPRRLPETTT